MISSFVYSIPISENYSYPLIPAIIDFKSLIYRYFIFVELIGIEIINLKF